MNANHLAVSELDFLDPEPDSNLPGDGDENPDPDGSNLL